MDEQTIVEQLRQKIAPPPVFTPAPKTPLEPVEGSSSTPDTLGEFTLMKIHDYFGERYKPNEAELSQYAEYIYTQVGGLINSTDYVEIMTKVQELERIAGVRFSENRMYKLYQWLRLDQVRREAEFTMGTLGD